MKKLFLFVILFIIVVIGILTYNYNNRVSIPVLGTGPAPWQPGHIRIPSIHVDAAIMNVGQTSSGEMEAPVSQAINSPYWTQAFWYDLGVAPGQVGNAVIAGHVNRVDGNPAVFWSLSDMKVGDTVSIETLNKTTLHFVVTRIAKYPAINTGKDTLQEVFGPTKEHHLNLITCHGNWTGQSYDQRLIVFTTQSPN